MGQGHVLGAARIDDCDVLRAGARAGCCAVGLDGMRVECDDERVSGGGRAGGCNTGRVAATPDEYERRFNMAAYEHDLCYGSQLPRSLSDADFRQGLREACNALVAA